MGATLIALLLSCGFFERAHASWQRSVYYIWPSPKDPDGFSVQTRQILGIVCLSRLLLRMCFIGNRDVVCVELSPCFLFSLVSFPLFVQSSHTRNRLRPQTRLILPYYSSPSSAEVQISDAGDANKCGLLPPCGREPHFINAIRRDGFSLHLAAVYSWRCEPQHLGLEAAAQHSSMSTLKSHLD